MITLQNIDMYGLIQVVAEAFHRVLGEWLYDDQLADMAAGEPDAWEMSDAEFNYRRNEVLRSLSRRPVVVHLQYSTKTGEVWGQI